MHGIIIKPNLEAKLDALAGGAKYDVCMASCNTNGATRGRVPDPQDPKHRWIFPAHLPGGGSVPILKVLQTNHCVNHCTYCAFGADKDRERRMSFSPQELADGFMKLVYQRLVEGLFLSSGVCGKSGATMERMVRTAQILREHHKFAGYIHLKILPGAPFDLVEQASRIASRISVNLEAPTAGHLSHIAPDKGFAKDLVTRMKWAGDLIRQGVGARSQTTQFVVGATQESDMDILRATDWIYREMFVFRAYFSAFQHPDKKRQSAFDKATLLREHRLYQSDYLLRGYGFGLPDLVFDDAGSLPERVDPKTAHAMIHPERFPVDINTAREEQLLRVPGIGPLSAQRIVQARVKNPYHSLDELKGVGAIVSRAAPYIEFSGRGVSQLRLFETPPPPRWQTGIGPAKKDAPGNGSEKAAYPGQVGKRLTYSGFNRAATVYCR